MSTATRGACRPAAVAEAVQLKAAARLLFVDNIRVFLTILVNPAPHDDHLCRKRVISLYRRPAR